MNLVFYRLLQKLVTKTGHLRNNSCSLTSDLLYSGEMLCVKGPLLCPPSFLCRRRHGPRTTAPNMLGFLCNPTRTPYRNFALTARSQTLLRLHRHLAASFRTRWFAKSNVRYFLTVSAKEALSEASFFLVFNVQLFQIVQFVQSVQGVQPVQGVQLVHSCSIWPQNVRN